MIKTLRSKYLSKFQSCQSKVPSPDVSTSMTNTSTRLSKRKVKKTYASYTQKKCSTSQQTRQYTECAITYRTTSKKKRVKIQLFSPDKVKVIKLMSSPSVNPGGGNLTTHGLPNVILGNFSQFWVCPPFLSKKLQCSCASCSKSLDLPWLSLPMIKCYRLIICM